MFDLVEIPLISSVPFRARTSAMKRERRRVGGDTSNRDLLPLRFIRIRFLTVRDVNYRRFSQIIGQIERIRDCDDARENCETKLSGQPLRMIA